MEGPKEDLENKKDSNECNDLSNKHDSNSGEVLGSKQESVIKCNLETDNNLESKSDSKEKKLYARLFKFLADGFSILLVILIVFVAYSAINDRGANGIAVGPFRIFNILSDSMLPVIKKGDVVLTQAVSKDQLQVRDIVTFMKSEDTKIMLTHRIVGRVDDDLFVTRGDANNTDDDPVHFNNIVGKVILTIPLLGVFIGFASTTDGFILLLVVFALFMVLIETIKRIVRT